MISIAVGTGSLDPLEIPIIVLALILIFIVPIVVICASGLTTKKLKGRTIREFKTVVNVWDILDRWAEARKYKLVSDDGTSRTYKSHSLLALGFVPMVQVRENGEGYTIEAWLVLRIVCRIFFLWFFPKEAVVDTQSYWFGWGDWHPMDIRHKAGMDLNTLIEMLNVDIEPIP